jgi:hypothetical protein
MGLVIAIFPQSTDLFAWYSIGLLVGFGFLRQPLLACEWS